MPQLGYERAMRYWTLRGSFTPQDWSLPCVVRRRGEVLGIQGAFASNFPVARVSDSYSWLGQGCQGQGVGTLARQMIVTFLFDELDADFVVSGSYADNPASEAVSRKLGYVANGSLQSERRPGERVVHNRWLLTRDRFVRPDQPVTVTGARELRVFAGVSRPGE